MNRKKNASTVLVYGVLIFITLICLFPIVWMCLISIKSTSESITGFNSLMVSNPTMANFKRLFEMIPVGQNAFNSVFTTIMGTITSLFFCALAGFAFAKYRFPGRKFLFYFVIATLLVPDPLLKNVQRNLLHHVLDGFTVSDSAAAYRKGASVAANAGMHQGRKIVMKMDIEDFFGSITFPMVLHHAFPAAYFPPAVGVMLASLCCCHDRLPQGAPTSPAISNLVMKPFDEYMEAWCGEREIVYSRYCDDMTFSGVFDGSEVKGKVYGFLRSMGFEPNLRKTRILTRGTRQVVTGLVVNERVRVPAPYRRGLRQEIYYCMKYGAKEHLTRTGRQAYLNDGDEGTRRYLESLLGKTAYVLLASGDGDAWFREAQVRLREMLRQDSCL